MTTASESWMVPQFPNDTLEDIIIGKFLTLQSTTYPGGRESSATKTPGVQIQSPGT